MSTSEQPFREALVLMDAEAMTQAIHHMAQEIVADSSDVDALAFLGILTRGRPLADRLAAEIEAMTGVHPPVGALATTLYRDDRRVKLRGETHFDFNVDGRTVLLVDDVLAAGRTIRAAMDEVMDYGRPRRIQLVCLIDRGGRELPIQPDYQGWKVGAGATDWVSVHLLEVDGEDVVLLERREPAQPPPGE